MAVSCDHDRWVPAAPPSPFTCRVKLPNPIAAALLMMTRVLVEGARRTNAVMLKVPRSKGASLAIVTASPLAPVKASARPALPDRSVVAVAPATMPL
jgi:hypothetical protein